MEGQIELENVQEESDNNQNSESIMESNEIKGSINQINIYLIFSINKTIFEKNEIDLRLFNFKEQNTMLIRYDEAKDSTKKNKIIQQLYCITFTVPEQERNEIYINLTLKLRKDLKYFKSNYISISKKEYIFLYDHSFEDLNKNYKSLNYLNLIQNKLDLQQKFIFFFKKLNPEKWENKALTISFIEDTFAKIKKENMPYNIIFILLEMTYKKTNLFYYILEEFYLNQNKIYFTKAFNVVKYRPFVDELAEEKKIYIDFDNQKEEIKNGKYLKNKEKLPFYFKILKETFYRKYDIKNYIILSDDDNFLQVIKQQIISRIITRKDNKDIDISVFNKVVKIMNSTDEIIIILKLLSSLSEILHFIIDNFEYIKNIYINANKSIDIYEIWSKIEEDGLENIKELHKKILELEKNSQLIFIDFRKIIHNYINHFTLSNLKNLIIIREMINNQKFNGDEIERLDQKINGSIHETGIAIAKKLKSNEIIDFITNIDKINYTRNDLIIVNEINIYELNDQDFIKFNGIWNKINNYNHDYLINIIFKKIGTIKDIGLIFRLVPDFIFDLNSVILLEKLFKNLFYTYNPKACPNILKDISKILLLFSISIYQPDDFISFIEDKLEKSQINNLYLDIIKNNKNLSEFGALKKRIIKFFTQQSYIDDIESIVYILGDINSSNNYSFINDFLLSLGNFILMEEDFFINQFHNKFQLYKYAQDIFNKRRDLDPNINYFKKSNKTLMNLYDKIIKFEFTFTEVTLIKQQIHQGFFKEKLKVINNNNFEYLYNLLCDNIKRYDKVYNDLIITLEFYKLFFEKTEKDFIENHINITIQSLSNQININFIEHLEKCFKENQKYIIAQKYKNLISSKFFLALFNDYKKKNKVIIEEEKTIFVNCIKDFCKLEILNYWDEKYSINKFPFVKIISEEIENIIKENKYNKKECEKLISQELDTVEYIYKIELSNPILNILNTDQSFVKLESILPKIKEEKEKKEEDIKKTVENKEKDNNIIEIEDKDLIKKDIILNNPNNEKIYIKKTTQDNFAAYGKKNINIVENLVYLPFLESLKKVLNSIKLLIELFNVEKTHIYNFIKEKFDYITKNYELITLKEIKENIDSLKNLRNIEINIVPFDKINDNNDMSVLVDLLNIICNNVEGIKFAFGKTNEEIRALSEFVGENENSKIQIKDIIDFMNVCDFIYNIKALEEESDDTLIGEFKNAFITTPSFGNSFNNYLKNYKEIKNVYEEYLDKPEVSRKKIEQILKYSKIRIFFNSNSRSIDISGSYTDILNNIKKFNNNDLQELHDRALLFSNKTFDNISNNVIKDFKKKQENSKIFVEIVENINVLVNYLFALYIKGYPNSIEVNIIIENSKAINKEKNNIKNIIEYYKNLTSLLEEAQTAAYKERPLIRLIYGQQFYDIYVYLNKKDNNINIIPLLSKLSDNKIKKIPDRIINDHNENNFKEMINAIDNFFKNCLEINKIEIKDLYKKNIIKNEFRENLRPGFYSWGVDETNYEIQLISVYKKLTGNLPLSITLLLCTKETNEEEITSFIYRALLCPFPVLFMIINSDNLELSNAQYFLWILEQLYEKNKNYVSSYLLILFSDINSELRKQLSLLNEHDYFIIENIDIHENNFLSYCNKIQNNYVTNPIEIWTSNAAGVGKSTKIKYEAEKSKLNYIYFPIGGSFTRKEIINRITQLEINNNYEKNYLHIDIYDSDKESSIIIREFLFSLLITRNYSFYEQIFYLGYGSKIVVEIPTGFYEMKNKFKLLNYFKFVTLSLENLPELREIEKSNDNNKKQYNITDIQLVTNILQMLENNTIENKTFILDKQYNEIPLKDCQNIINKYFTLEKGNYYQKMAFIHILADQFKKFCCSFYLKPEILIQNESALKFRKYKIKNSIIQYKKDDAKITNVRKIMIENLIKLTLYFVKGPYNKIVLNQKNTNIQLFEEFNEKKINEIANKSLSSKDEIISFEKINPSLVFFNEDIQTFSIITTSKQGEEEYNQLLRLYNSQLNIKKDEEKLLINYRALSHEEFLPEVKNILNANTLSIEQISKILGSYCFTSDNFIKMILILLRIRAGIPIIMMGETGCGKTSLIKILSTLLNKGIMNLQILNIHAGIKDQDIIKFIEDVNKKANDNNNSLDKIWVFFDEINTCNSMGLISEIFYKHTYYGKKLNNRLTFIAACNPYRLKKTNIEKRKKEEQEDFCLINEDKNNYNNKQKLVYLVNPLPHSLLTSIFDFGNLSPDDEKKYIRSIVKETLKKFNIESKNIEKLFVDEIILCQNYIRENNDVSSVSLRELRRFNILFEFFFKYLNDKKDDNNNNNNNKKNNEDKCIDSLYLCLYFCYYIRLSNNNLRKELKKKIENVSKDKKGHLKIIQKEKEFIASKVKIPSGIAKNKTLLENIFSLFVCIVNKIPLIICGKPGTSKSLSFQILYDSMKGERSENNFFRKYPELLVFSYQGSKTSTSEGIENVFNKARSCLKKNKEKNDIIPVFYFDEMGLAEDSPNNPLKVIHSQLEYDDNEQKIAFVGISNWILDASKMNRTIFLGVPPLREKDLEQTAEEIASNLDKELFLRYKDLFVKLVKTYCKYKTQIKSTEQREFHGLRDFYHLIKNAMNYIIIEKKDKKDKNDNIDNNGNEKLNSEEDNNNININEKSYEIGIKSLFRNFNGLKRPFNSFDTIKKIFDDFYKEINKDNYKNTFNVFDCLRDNIKDNNSRYLLIIMESSICIHLLNNIMQELNKKYIFYSGSQLKEDVNQEKYNEKLLNKIQLSLENGDVLVLKNMENIYPSLYNLFNQNFTILGGKKFARIVFANYKSYSVVNDEFRAIVLVDEEQIMQKMEDPPFLNRFEKHTFSYDNLMEEMELKITNQIINYLELVLSYNNKNCKLDLEKQVIWYNKEEIKGLVFKEYNKLKNNKDKIIGNENDLYNSIIKKLSILFSQDILASIMSIDADLKDNKMPKDLLDYYRLNHYHNFRELFNYKRSIFNNEKNTKLIIYTFSKLLEPCIKANETINSSFEIIDRNNISEKIVNSIKNENDLEDILDNYYNNELKKILVFKFAEADLNKMNQIKIKINQFEIEKGNNEKYQKIIPNKHIVFLISLARHRTEKVTKKNLKNQKTIINDLISNIDEEYKQLFIDNLHGKNDTNIIDMFLKSPCEYINEVFDKKNKSLMKIINQIFSYLTYEFKNEASNENNIQNNINGDTYIKEIIKKLSINEYLLNMLKKKIEKEFNGNLNDIINSIFLQGIFEKNDTEFIDIIYKVINDKIYLLLFKFIFKSEREHFLSPLLLNYEFISQEKKNLEYIDKYINDFNFLLVNVVERINSNKILLILNLSFPLSKKWYDSLNIFIEKNIKEGYMLNEENLRCYSIEEKNLEKEFDNFSKNKNDFINNVKGEIQRIDGLNDLIKSKNINYMKMIYKDFMTIYLTKKYNENIDLGIKFLDVLIQLKLNINKDNKYSFIDNNKKQINLQDSFSTKLNKNNIINEELNIKFDEENLSKVLIFLISYSEEIYSLLGMFYILNKYINNFFDDWKSIILNKEIKYEINQHNPIFTREVNESFFIICESLIKCIFINQDKYKNIQEDIFYEYLDSLQKFSKIAIQIYYKLYLPRNEVYTLQILINIFTSFETCRNKKNVNISIQDIFIKIIYNILNENIYVSQKYYEELEENYKSLLKILDDLIDKKSNEKEYSLLLNNLFIFRFNKCLDYEYRKKLSIIYFTDIGDNQLNYILPILKILLGNTKPFNIEDDENLDENHYVDLFLDNFININNDKLELYKIINDKKSDILDLNILYYFECECELYFRNLSEGKKLNNIKDKKNIVNYMKQILSNLSLKYFKKAMDCYLDEINLHQNAKKLGKIYAIAYIKNYIKILAEFISYNENKNILSFEDIFKVLLCKKNNKKIFTLKIFLFKCLFIYEKKNYHNFIESIKNKNYIKNILTHDDFSNLFLINENKHSYTYSMININAYEYYCNLNRIIDININEFNQNQQFNSISTYINDNNYKGLDLLYNILVNKYILDLYGNDNNNEELSEKANIILNKFPQININLHENSKKIINYIINKKLFNSKILPKLKLPGNNKISSEQLNILLLCIKLVILIQYNPNNLFSLFYSNKDLKKFLSDNYFPGSYQAENDFIEAYYEIDNFLKTHDSNNAIYICSCGKYYVVPPCGFPTQKSKCTKCKQDIGGLKHILVRRDGHYRIFLNEKAKDLEFKKSYADKTMPFKYLDQFKSEIIDPLLNKPNKGIGKMSKEIINKTGNNIRNINELSFRILNLVLCSHLLIANILDILKEGDMTKYFSEEISCFAIILDNWNKIVELLNKNKINNIYIYMNIIYEKLIDIFNKYDKNSLNTYQMRDTIENEINIFINENLEIGEKIKLYENYNQSILNFSPDNISSLIQELYPMKFYNNENEYPYFKYLYYYNYPNSDSLFRIIESNNNYKNKYPLTYNILKYNNDNNNEIEKLKYIPKINKKINLLIHNYSYKISRDEALEKTIKDEFKKTEDNKFIMANNNNNQNIDEYLRDLVNLFKSFQNIDLRWDCHKLKNMELSVKESKLASILLDDSEPGYYLSSIYRKLIEYQNVFLENIINCNSQNGLLHCFVKQLDNEIMIQDSGVNEIVKLDFEENNNNIKLYSNVDELIFINTTNNPFINKFNYELDQIEVELGNIILPGVRKFKSSDDELRYVTYQFEGYRGKNSYILTNFNEKYPPQELNNKEKSILKKYINENEDYKESLFSLQLLIDYIQKTGKNQNMSISEVIRNIPDHINIIDEIKNFFITHTEFSVNKLVRIFELFEHLCWDQIKDNLLDEYKKNIDDEKSKLISEYYIANPDKKNYIKKIELAGAVRKLISRYLAGKRSQSETNEDKNLFDYLSRVDLWVRNIDDDNFEKEYFKLSKLKITVGEGKDFYDKLGGDSQLLNLNIEENNKNHIKNNFIIIEEENKKEQDNDNPNKINLIEDEEEKEKINLKIKEKNDKITKNKKQKRKLY